ncbi:cysteine hydrolase family protein [Actinophytocola sp.]|uniref:cysteine hydrolase family protein n=1 Tax=Actinophytocola sp. TaxID=1872138 RepID=UPI003D6A2FB1
MSRSGLVLVDLQREVLGRVGDRDVLLGACRAAMESFLGKALPVVLVRVVRRADGSDAPVGPGLRTGAGPLGLVEGTDGAELVTELADLRPRCHEVIKRRRGAFTGTDLDVLCRGLAVDTLFVGGVDTVLGVESTVRSAYDLGYRVVVLADCCRGADQADHSWTLDRVLPRMATVATSTQLDELLETAEQIRVSNRP